MSTANIRSSARNSKLPTGMHNSASELMMKHARKEQMLVAEVVTNIFNHSNRVEAQIKGKRTCSLHHLTHNPRTMFRMWHLSDLTANSLPHTEKMKFRTSVLSSNIQDCGQLIMIRSMKKRTPDNIIKMEMNLSKSRSNRYWMKVRMSHMMKDISLRSSWEGLLRKTRLPLGSTLKQMMEDTDTWSQLPGDSNSNQPKCKQAAAPFNYNKYRTIATWFTKGNQLMKWSSLVLEKKSKEKLFVYLPKNKSRSLSNTKMSKNKLRL